MFIRKLSELRNIVVHNIQHINFDLKLFFSRLEKNQRETFVNAFTYFVETPEGESSWRNATMNDPRHAISCGV